MEDVSVFIESLLNLMSEGKISIEQLDILTRSVDKLTASMERIDLAKRLEAIEETGDPLILEKGRSLLHDIRHIS